VHPSPYPAGVAERKRRRRGEEEEGDIVLKPLEVCVPRIFRQE